MGQSLWKLRAFPLNRRQMLIKKKKERRGTSEERERKTEGHGEERLEANQLTSLRIVFFLMLANKQKRGSSNSVKQTPFWASVHSVLLFFLVKRPRKKKKQVSTMRRKWKRKKKQPNHESTRLEEKKKRREHTKVEKCKMNDDLQPLFTVLLSLTGFFSFFFLFFFV